jgi:hypothetical protein
MLKSKSKSSSRDENSIHYEVVWEILQHTKLTLCTPW